MALLFKLICSSMVLFVQASGSVPPIILSKSTPEVPQNTFYSAINNSCINASKLMTQENEVFKNCINATEITNTIKLTSNNTQTVKCLLYYNRIVSYCKSNTSQVHYPTLKEISESYNPSEICQGVSNYSKDLFKPDGISPYRCILLCGNLDEQFAPECLFAHYYHTQLNAMKHVDKQSTQQPDNQQLNVHQDINEQNVGNEKILAEAKPKIEDKLTNTQSSQSVKITDAGDNAKNIQTLNEADLSKKDKISKKPEVPATLQFDHSNKQITQQTGTDNKAKESNVEEPSKNDEAPVKPSQPIKTTKAPVSPKEPPNTSADKPNSIPIEPSDTEMEDQEIQNYNNANDESIPLDIQQQQSPAEEEKEKSVDRKPDTLQENPINVENVDEIDGESYFMSYFMVICVLVVLGYVGYHNRVKVMALLLEGKRNRRQNRGRRPNSANYHKLDSNLEEAISSNVTKNSTNVIY